jgi:hypothetical protein
MTSGNRRTDENEGYGKARFQRETREPLSRKDVISGLQKQLIQVTT